VLAMNSYMKSPDNDWLVPADIDLHTLEACVRALHGELASIVNTPRCSGLFRRYVKDFVEYGRKFMCSMDGLRLRMEWEHSG
jgi:hypothetical protein